MSRPLTLALAAAVLASAACTPPPANGPAGVDTLRGRTAVVGSAPMNVRVALQAEDGRSIYLTGPLTDELGRLSGAELEIHGRMNGSEMEPTSYRVVSVDGRPALVGVVETAPGGGLQLRLEDGSAVRLGGGAGDLRPGQKVWVQGPSQVQVQTFGVIAP
jgi:hypothetical protein